MHGKHKKFWNLFLIHSFECLNCSSMHIKVKPFAILLLLTLLGCSSSNHLTQGKVSPTQFRASTPFTTAKGLILLPCKINGETKNFIFDTGAMVTNIHRDTLVGELITVRGGSNRTTESGTETVPSIEIAGVDFLNTFATNSNEAYLKEKIPNYGGTLGRTIIDKANWLINYPARTVELSNAPFANEDFTNIPLIGTSGTPYTSIAIDGNEYKSIIDLGSTSTMNVPEGTELAKLLLSNYTFEEKTRERYTVGGMQTITERIGTIPLLTIGTATFTNVKVNINVSSQIRLGMLFFEDYLTYIDNENHRLMIRKVN